MEEYKYVIIGSGAAGVNAAQKISSNSDEKILILTEESVPHYYRPKLIDYIAGKSDFKEFKFYDEKWYDERDIIVKYEQRVEEIDTDKKTVKTDSNNIFKYEKLLIATGGKPFIPPPFRDVDSYTVRIIEDADAVINQAKQTKNWCIIGGGLLGLEIGNALQNRNAKVTIIEAAPYPLPLQLDEEGGKFLHRKIQDLGMNLITDAKVEKIKENTVFLDDGTNIEYQALLFCTGIRPDIEIAEKAGIETDKAILVNDYFETNVKDVYAAGDSCIHNGKMYGIWMPALEQGQNAGLNMAGEKTRYTGSDPRYKLKVVGVDVVSVGKIDSPAQTKFANKEKGIYKKAFIDDEKLVGFILYGDISDEFNLKENLGKDFSLSEKYFQGTKENEMSENASYVCGVCGYVYDPAKGDPDRGIEPGTAFEDLPDDWNCPVCGAPKEQFSKE